MPNKSFDLILNPFAYRISTSYAPLFNQLKDIYPSSVLCTVDKQKFIDFEISFDKPFYTFDSSLAFRLGDKHFRFAEREALIPTFEWGLNWCIGNFQSHFLSIHAAVLEKNGKSIILPAPPGSGKSTLCAMMMFAGWRLLSDEHCLIDLSNGMIVPCVRPISLKNKSIDVIKRLYPDVLVQQITEDTHKGTIGYIAPSAASWLGATVNVAPAFVIFPKYQSEQNQIQFQKLNQHQIFMQLAENSFNYSVLGAKGFESMANFVSKITGFTICYNNGQDALAILERLCE